jgi:hypothetical protein
MIEGGVRSDGRHEDDDGGVVGVGLWVVVRTSLRVFVVPRSEAQGRVLSSLNAKEVIERRRREDGGGSKTDPFECLAGGRGGW